MREQRQTSKGSRCSRTARVASAGSMSSVSSTSMSSASIVLIQRGLVQRGAAALAALGPAERPGSARRCARRRRAIRSQTCTHGVKFSRTWPPTQLYGEKDHLAFKHSSDAITHRRAYTHCGMSCASHTHTRVLLYATRSLSCPHRIRTQDILTTCVICQGLGRAAHRSRTLCCGHNTRRTCRVPRLCHQVGAEWCAHGASPTAARAPHSAWR